MTVAAARCLILTPTISSSAAALRLPRIARRRPLSCSASPLAVFATMDSPPEGYRTNVGICLADPSLTKIFSASRIDIPTAWQMPQGGIDPGEEPRAAAVRELREETGVRSAEIVAEAPNWLTYDFPADVKDKLNARWGTNWKGQAQKWHSSWHLTNRILQPQDTAAEPYPLHNSLYQTTTLLFMPCSDSRSKSDVS
uniref:Nudix hydrolase domain-containing protein n=1 Tax=Triticum urartu TaxID=4572 RepID=A0A8R7PMD0_TRIUA